MRIDLHRTLLATPLGQAGSGRIRYGAAMALHGAGEIGDAELEVYRICSAYDLQDPAAVLREEGLAAPVQGVLGQGVAIRLLVDEVDRYLAALCGPGVGEARAGLNAARGEAAPVLAPAGGANAVVAAHLPQALAALAQTHPALAQALGLAAMALDWMTYDAYPLAEIGADFAGGHAYASIIGEGSPIAARDYDLGLLLIAPHVLYRDHRHLAPELYAPLTGPHGWRFGPDAPLVVKAAHMPIWNAANAPHLTKVGPVPFLCIYAWTRDVNAVAQVVHASDWAELAALRLDA